MCQHLYIKLCQVENLIAIELAYINTNHPDFVGGTRAAYESMARRVRNLELSPTGQVNLFFFTQMSQFQRSRPVITEEPNPTAPSSELVPKEVRVRLYY